MVAKLLASIVLCAVCWKFNQKIDVYFKLRLIRERMA